MGDPDLLFVAWWYLALGVVVVSAWLLRDQLVDWGHVIQVFLVGVGVALSLYLVPSGVDSIESIREFEIRFLCALAITWLAGEWVVRHSERPGSMPVVALAGFVAVNVPPLALIASATMVCGGSPSCL